MNEPVGALIGISVIFIVSLYRILSDQQKDKKLLEGPTSQTEATIDNITSSFRSSTIYITYTFVVDGIPHTSYIKVPKIDNLKTLDKATVTYLESDPSINILTGYEQTLKISTGSAIIVIAIFGIILGLILKILSNLV
ncbi:MAG: hypothetical protein MJ169_05155 [Treponema sp.]|nr:hypothetical protein [Treponema sp.]